MRWAGAHLATAFALATFSTLAMARVVEMGFEALSL